MTIYQARKMEEKAKDTQNDIKRELYYRECTISIIHKRGTKLVFNQVRETVLILLNYRHVPPAIGEV